MATPSKLLKKIRNSVVTRSFNVTGTMTLALATSAKINVYGWGTYITSMTDWSRIASMYQQFRLRRVTAQVLPMNAFMTTAGSVPMAGSFGFDPCADVSTGSASVYDFVDLYGGKLLSSGTDPKWSGSSYEDRKAVQSNVVDISTNSATLGVWNSVDHISVLLGSTFVGLEQPAAWVYTANQIVAIVSHQFVIDFREPIEYNISASLKLPSSSSYLPPYSLVQKDTLDEKAFEVIPVNDKTGETIKTPQPTRPQLSRVSTIDVRSTGGKQPISKQ
jgi:hypothetical protein